jgi:chemotaxis protein CheX
LHPDLIKQLDEAVAEVFNMMLGRVCAPELNCRSLALCTTCDKAHDLSEPHTEELTAAEVAEAADHKLTAHIAFSGCVRGECSVRLDFGAAAEVTEALIGMPPGDLPDDERDTILADTVGELCNMIAGGWKSRLRGQGACCALSTPLVTSGPSEAPLEGVLSIRRCYRLTDTCLNLEFTVEA